jgi:glycosyltransferase involved in cell wall biosynthesis
MAQISNKPVLSLCIPIYNRLAYLERQLKRFLEDKELFQEKIQLVISDNCSEDDLASCCQYYIDKGLNIIYHRNETNIGPDANFEWCFYHAEGEYVWLLGSDDIPVHGFLKKLVHYLEKGEYGLVHLSMKKRNQELSVFNTSDEMAVAVNYWITFMSANIIRSESLKSVDLSDFKNSFMIQVPAYLNACCSYSRNAILYLTSYFERETDNANNGGYNFFQVFVTNLYNIYDSFVNNGLLSKGAFDRIQKIEYKEYLVDVIIHNLILKQKRNFSVDGGWSILKEYYKDKAYAYIYIVIRIFTMPFTSVRYKLTH